MMKSLAKYLALAAGAVMALAAATAQAATQTYQLLVFADPVAGQEAEFNRWYGAQHALDVVSVPGFVSVQRFERSEVQLRAPVMPAPKPRYLALYTIVTDDLPGVFAEVNRRIRSGETKMSPSFDIKSSQAFTYRLFRPQLAGTAIAGVADTPANSAVHLVFSDPLPGQDDAFNAWYDTKHAPEIAAIPGFVSAQRSVWADAQMIPNATGRRYLTLFTVRTGDLATAYGEFGARAPKMTMSPAFNGAGTEGFAYRAIGPVISGDAVRAARSKAPTAR